MEDKQFLLGILVLILIGIALFSYFYAGINYLSDDANYVHYANQIINGTFHFNGVYSLNLLTSVNFALSYLLFHDYIVLNLFEYLSIIILTYLIGKKIIDNLFGLIAGFIVTTLPFVIQYASRGFPEMLLGFLFSLSLYLILRNSRLALLAGTLGLVKLGGFGISLMISISLVATRQYKLAGYVLLGLILSIGFFAVLFFSLGGTTSLISNYSQV